MEKTNNEKGEERKNGLLHGSLISDTSLDSIGKKYDFSK